MAAADRATTLGDLCHTLGDAISAVEGVEGAALAAIADADDGLHRIAGDIGQAAELLRDALRGRPPLFTSATGTTLAGQEI